MKRTDGQMDRQTDRLTDRHRHFKSSDGAKNQLLALLESWFFFEGLNPKVLLILTTQLPTPFSPRPKKK